MINQGSILRLVLLPRQKQLFKRGEYNQCDHTMSQLIGFSRDRNFKHQNSDKDPLFQTTTQQFKKYTIIEANRKIKSFFKNDLIQNSKSKPPNQYQIPLQQNESNRQTMNYVQKYFPVNHFNPKLKLKKHSFKLITNINSAISIDDNSDEEKDKNNNISTIDKKFLKESRSYSLKTYLDQQLQKHLILPKIGKTQNIIEIIQNQFKQSKQKKNNNPRLASNHKITLERENQNHQNSELKKSKQLQQIIKKSSKQKLKSLIQIEGISSQRKRRKIQLMGMKLKPVERDQSKIARLLQNRTQRTSCLNLLPSQLIYKNQKQGIQKSVYQQLIKRVFSSS